MANLYANLQPYQPQQAQNPLESLIQGFSTGQAIQRLPQTQAEQQLASQLNLALMAQKLKDLQNPNAALARQVQEQLALKSALNPDLGIETAPIGLAGETIGTPNAIPFTASQLNAQEANRQNLLTQRQIASDQGGIPFQAPPAIEVPNAAPGLPITPISIGGTQTGFNINPNIPRQVEARKESAALNKLRLEQDIKDRLQGVSPGQSIVERQPDGTFKEVFQSPPKAASLGAPQFVRSTADPKDVRLVPVGESGLPPEGYEFVKTGEQGMKPSEKITAIKEVRSVYDELPSKIQLFGKGQIMGSNQLKGDLDALLNPVKGDFNKLSPQALKAFVFRANKLNDQTSATLLAEARQIAERTGIANRFEAYIENLKSGKDVSPEVAKDIYNIISQVQASHREQLVNALIPLREDTDSLNKKLTSIGVPKELQDEVDKRIAQGEIPQPVAPEEMVDVINPNGQLGSIPSSKLPGALKAGYKQAP